MTSPACSSVAFPHRSCAFLRILSSSICFCFVCPESGSQLDLDALSPGVSWWYNWHSEPGSWEGHNIDTSAVEFVPMYWGKKSWDWNQPCRFSAPNENHVPKYVLGFNEPNFVSQANMVPNGTFAPSSLFPLGSVN